MILNEFRLGRKGQDYAFGSVLLFAAAAVLCALFGHDKVAIAFVAGDGAILISLVVAFLKGKKIAPRSQASGDDESGAETA